jgi:ATP-dependent DNA helicase RecQ
LLELLRAILQADPKAGLSTDDLAMEGGMSSIEVGRALHDLETMGLLENDSRIVAYLRVGVPGASMTTLKALNRLESALLALLRESAPDAARATEPVLLNLPMLAQALKDAGFADVLPHRISHCCRRCVRMAGKLPAGWQFGLRRWTTNLSSGGAAGMGRG